MPRPANSIAVMAQRHEPVDSVDFFPTPPWGARAAGELVKRIDPGAVSAWDPACGAGHMTHGLRDCFDVVHGSDLCLYDRNVVHDFLGHSSGARSSAASRTSRPDAPDLSGALCAAQAAGDRVASVSGPPYPVDWIITNPPFNQAEAFIGRALSLARRGAAMLMRVGMQEGVGRYELMWGPRGLTLTAPFIERLPMGRNRYDPEMSTAAFYAVFVFVKVPALRRRLMVRFGGRLYPSTMPIPPGTESRLTRPSDARFAVRNPDAPSIVGIGPVRTGLLIRVAEAGERGVTPLTGVYPGGLLASLKGDGLLEHAPAVDALGDRRFRVSALGRERLTDLGVRG